MTVLLFLGCLALSIVSSQVLAGLLDRAANRFRLPEGVVGIITALGADSPEIAAAVTAVAVGSGDLGVGVVLGSNLYNVAALLGLPAVVAGAVRIRRRALMLQAAVALGVSVVAALLVTDVIPPVPSLILVIAVLGPYIAVSSLSARRLRRIVPDGAARRFLELAVVDQEKDSRSGQTPRAATGTDLLTIVPVLVSVVLASVGLVDTARTLGSRWGISDVVIGTLVLAALTGIPNVLASVRLARRRRGSAVVSEGLNSNSINILIGLCLPAVLVGIGPRTNTGVLESVWLVATTALVGGLTFFRGGLLRHEGLAVIAAYVAFVVVLLVR